MKILELFSGFGDISRSFAEQGHEIYRVDWNEKLDAELHADISKLTADDIIELCGGVPDVIWASPDCTTYSIATHRHRTKQEGLLPKTQYAWQCDMTNVAMWNLIDELVRRGTKYYFVENPRGRMRHMPFVEGRTRHTITYCTYGNKATANGYGEQYIMKPTDIWTNHPNPDFLPQCSVNTDQHIHGTWALAHKRDYLSRGTMPRELCDHIARIGAV